MQLLLITFLNFKDCQRQKADTRLRRESAERPNTKADVLSVVGHTAKERIHAPSIATAILRTRPIAAVTIQLDCNTTTIQTTYIT